MRLPQFVVFYLLYGWIFLSNLAYADTEAAFLQETLRVGFYARSFPDFSLEDLEVSVKLLSEEIGNEAGIPTTVMVFDDIALMRKAFENGTINLVVASSLNLAIDFDDEQFADGFRLIISTNLADSLLVVTRKNEGLDTIKALQGKKLVLVESDPVANLYMEYLALSVFHKSKQASFREMPREKKATQTILKLFFGQADVICVYQNSYRLATELNPQLLSKLQVISELDGIPQGAGLFHKLVPEKFRERVNAEVLKLNSHPRGQQLLQLFKADKAIRSTTADLAATKQLYFSYKKMTKSK